jgi:hypothetical protein
MAAEAEQHQPMMAQCGGALCEAATAGKACKAGAAETRERSARLLQRAAAGLQRGKRGPAVAQVGLWSPGGKAGAREAQLGQIGLVRGRSGQQALAEETAHARGELDSGRGRRPT